MPATFSSKDFRAHLSRQRRALCGFLLGSGLLAGLGVFLYTALPSYVASPPEIRLQDYVQRWQSAHEFRDTIRDSLLPIGGAVVGLAALVGVTRVPKLQDGEERNAQFAAGHDVTLVATIALGVFAWLAIPIGGAREDLSDLWLPVAALIIAGAVGSQLIVSSAMRLVALDELCDLKHSSEKVYERVWNAGGTEAEVFQSAAPAVESLPSDFRRGVRWIVLHACTLLLTIPTLLFAALLIASPASSGWGNLAMTLSASVAFTLIFLATLFVATYTRFQARWKFMLLREGGKKRWTHFLEASFYRGCGFTIQIAVLLLLLLSLSGGGAQWVWALAGLCALAALLYPYLYRRFYAKQYQELVSNSILAYWALLDRSEKALRNATRPATQTVRGKSRQRLRVSQLRPTRGSSSP